MALYFDPFLAHDIHQMYEREQKVLRAIQICCGPHRCDEHLKIIQELCDRHLPRLKNIISKHEWPGNSLIGKEGVKKFCTLIQHCDRDVDFQELCLGYLQVAIRNQEASAEYFAYLADRSLRNRGLKQLYGTQLRIIHHQLVPYPISDENSLAERREEFGLEPLNVYLDQIKKLIEGSKDRK
jgi:hypothetical protein